MRRILLGVLLLSSAPLIGTQPSPQSLLAAERDAFVTAYSRPWHRIVRFILFSGDKKREITGTVEDTVYSPFHQKRTYSSTNESFSIYTLPEGTFTDRKKAILPGMLRFGLQGMSPQLVPQLLPKDRFLAVAALPDTHFSCYQIERRDDSGIAFNSRSVPSFCFDQSGTLRTVTLEHIVTAVNAQLRLNQRYVPSRVLIATEGGPLVSLDTVLLEPLPENGTIQKPSEAIYPGERSEITPCDSGGTEATLSAPTSLGTRGVLLDVHINEEGKVDRTSVITSASSLFEGEAQDEVRKRKYAPCVIAGQATDYGLTTLWWGRDHFRFRKGPFSRF